MQIRSWLVRLKVDEIKMEQASFLKINLTRSDMVGANIE